jgi:hypothetical protein
MLAAQHVHWYGWVGLGLLALGLIVVLYWVLKLLRFVVSAPFRAIGSVARRRQQKSSGNGLGSEYEQLVLSTPGWKPVPAEGAPSSSSLATAGSAPPGYRYVRRSRIEAAALTFVFVVASFAALGGATLLGHVIAGTAGALIVGYIGELALLVFLTLRAYPPGVKPPWIRFFVITFFLTALLPTIYLSWLWLTGKKWPEPTSKSAMKQPAAA